MRQAQELHNGWTLRYDAAGAGTVTPPNVAALRDIPATVPGCVHTDLLSAGLIEDPFVSDAEPAVAWVGRCDWRYDTVVPPVSDDHERTDLVFDGLDTVAEVFVAGESVGATRNMHRQYRFDVTDRVGHVETDLSVAFTSAYVAAERERDRLGDRPNSYPEPFNFVRKMACSFGWDWGPTLPTAGIWRPVRLERWSTARLAEVRPLATLDDGVPVLTVHTVVERADSGRERDLLLRVEVDTEAGMVRSEVPVVSGDDSATLRVPVEDARVWWPQGRGDQPLYPCRVSLHDALSAAALDRRDHRIGFRNVAVDTSEGAFTLRINEKPIFVRGVNWIPDDVFPSRITPERYRRRLMDAAEAGVDMIRVWGGGIYESESFYEACDEIGLLVWQDFPFACAAYPEEEPHRSEVEAEARQAVARLSGHASLVLWNGNNENQWGYADWGWRESLGEQTWGEGYYSTLLPGVVAELDESRPYTAGSPWSGSWEHHPNDPAVGTHHSWEVWNRLDYSHYRENTPRFVSEFGWQAPPAWRTLQRAIGQDELRLDSAILAAHQKAPDGQDKLARGLAAHFPPPRDFDAWHYLTQLNQVRAVRTGIEHWRSHWPYCAGTIVWQLNDCWPVISWAAVDGAGRRKPLWHALRECYDDRLITIQPRDGQLSLVAVNNGDRPWQDVVTLSRYTLHGERPAGLELELDVPAGSGREFPVPTEMGWAGRPGEFIVADAKGPDGASRRATWFAEHPETRQPVASRRVTVAPVDGGLDVTVHSAGVIRDLLLQADRLDPAATVDRGFVTLLPGESTGFKIRAPRRLDPAGLDEPYVLASLADVLNPDQDD